MSRLVEGGTGALGVVLPFGWVLNAGDQAVISDEEWALVQADAVLLAQLNDLGASTAAVSYVPHFRDHQRVARAYVEGELAAAGVGDNQSLSFTFASPSALWTMTHNLGLKPVSVFTVDQNGDPVIGDISFPSINQATVSWYAPLAGTAYVST